MLTWLAENAEKYSYILSETPVEIPDDIAEGAKTNVTYKDLSSGTHYFHIKAFRDGRWGGITNFAINVDTEPPANFRISLEPSPPTTARNVVAKWETTDAHSGLDYYEYAVINLHPGKVEAAPQPQVLFVEADSPQVLSLDVGEYDLIVRAYDKTGNMREAVRRIEILTPFQMALRNVWIWAGLLIITLLLTYITRKTIRYRRHIELVHGGKRLPNNIQKQLQELQEYRRKYGKMAAFLLVFGVSLLAVGVDYRGQISVALAQTEGLAPPFVSSISRNISNEEIFYIGGKTDGGNVDVVVYLQSLTTGETKNLKVTSDNRGNWFYRHNAFLPAGNYLLWVQSRLGEELSPPSPQIQMEVRQTALQFGASRVSWEQLYLILAVFLLALNLGLAAFIWIHLKHARKRRKQWLKEVHEAEESVRRGFAVLKRDIERELEIIQKAKMSKELSAEEKRREEQLLKDLRWAEQYIGKEIWDIEETDRGD